MSSSAGQSSGAPGKGKKPVSGDDNTQGIIKQGLSGATHAPHTSGDSPICIFKIPECLTHNRHNSYGYQPTIVSIGPYYQGRPQLNWIENQKEKFQDFFITKTGNGVNKEQLNDAVKNTGKKIEESYPDSSGVVDNENLINTMVLDGCFILTLFLRIARKIEMENEIFSMPWALPSIRRDLLLLGNQIPLFVLDTLLETANFPWESGDVRTLALAFFEDSFKNREQSSPNQPPTETSTKTEAKHLLDLIRRTFIPIQPPTDTSTQTSDQTNVNISSESNASNQPQASAAQHRQTNSVRLPLPANKLRSRGMKFKLKNGAQSFLDISFINGELQIPEIILDDFMSVVLLNCIAFEQFHAGSKAEITSYAMFMGCLTNSESDVAYLVEKGIIQNYLGSELEVSQFFKRILNDYVFDIESSYLAVAIKNVDRYASNSCNVMKANFKQTYLGSPWILASKLAALALLLLTVAQVVLAAIALKRPNSPK